MTEESERMTDEHKPRKRDFASYDEFYKAATTWAAKNMNEWPWGGPKDDDDDYYFVATADTGSVT